MILAASHNAIHVNNQTLVLMGLDRWRCVLWSTTTFGSHDVDEGHLVIVGPWVQILNRLVTSGRVGLPVSLPWAMGLVGSERLGSIARGDQSVRLVSQKLFLEQG